MAEVWRRHFPDLAEPPVWIELQLFPDFSDSCLERFTLVTFSVAGPQKLTSPEWCRMNDADVACLVGAPVARDRGEGYQPWPREPDDLPVYQVAWTILLPRPKDVDRGCMSGTAPWWRCLGRQIVPRRRVRDCCYYHRIDWHQACAAATRITQQLHRDGLSGETFADRAFELARAEGLAFEEDRALTELLADGAGIQIGRDDDGHRHYLNGRHRTTAMLDSGIRRTAVIHWETPDNAKIAQ